MKTTTALGTVLGIQSLLNAAPCKATRETTLAITSLATVRADRALAMARSIRLGEMISESLATAGAR